MSDIKFDKLQQLLKKYRRLLIAYSGGLDSGFLLWSAIKAIGPENVFAVTALSPSYPEDEKNEAVKFARELGLPENNFKMIETNEMDIPEYRANSFERCFHCKNELYGKLKQLADEFGCEAVADGFNKSDFGDFRPGHDAAQKYGVISPLAETGLDKSDIREIARKNNLALADKPASACLASRIPFGSSVTVEKLRQIDKAEAALKRLGFSGHRVRHHGEIARLELRQEDFTRINNDTRDQIAALVKAAGFKYVTLDLEGYRQGIFNPDQTSKAKGDSDE